MSTDSYIGSYVPRLGLKHVMCGAGGVCVGSWCDPASEMPDFLSDPVALEMAVSVLPPVNVPVELRLVDGTALEGWVVGQDESVITVAGPAGWVRSGDQCMVLVSENSRAGYEIDGRVAEFAQVDQDRETIRLAVSAVRRVKSRRATGRVPVRETAAIDMATDATYVVVVDVSTLGFAFTTTHALEVGDELSVVLNVSGQVVLASAQVANITQIEGHHLRVGCQFLEVSETSRRLLEQLALDAKLPLFVAHHRSRQSWMMMRLRHRQR